MGCNYLQQTEPVSDHLTPAGLAISAHLGYFTSQGEVDSITAKYGEINSFKPIKIR